MWTLIHQCRQREMFGALLGIHLQPSLVHLLEPTSLKISKEAVVTDPGHPFCPALSCKQTTCGLLCSLIRAGLK